jgi:predicted site-specific integrase-resolvase
VTTRTQPYTTLEASRLIGISDVTAWRWAKKGQLTVIGEAPRPQGGRPRILVSPESVEHMKKVWRRRNSLARDYRL